MSLRSFINFGESLSVGAGIHIRILSDQVFDISFCLLKKNNGRVTVVKTVAGIPSLEMLKNEIDLLPAASSAHINMSGWGVLSRAIGVDDMSLEANVILQKIFPMLNEAEFANQILEVGDAGILFIARHQIIDNFESLVNKLTISDLTFSICPLVAILPFLANQTLLIGNNSVEINNHAIVSIHESAVGADVNSPITIGDDTISSNEILAYSSAWNALFSDALENGRTVKWIERSGSEFAFHKTLFKAGRVALFSCLVLLFINGIVNYWLTQKTTLLEVQQRFTSTQHSRDNRLSERVDVLANAYDRIGWNTNEIPLYYADQIALQVASDEIRLTTLEVGVLDENLLRKEKLYDYQPNMIRMKGIAESPVSLHHFISRIENLSWIEEIVGRRYQYDAKQKKGFFEFYIHTK